MGTLEIIGIFLFLIVLGIWGIGLIRRAVGFGGATSGAGRGIGAAFRGIGHGIRWCWRHPRFFAGVATFAALNALLLLPFVGEAITYPGWVLVMVLEALLAVALIGAWSGNYAGHIVGGVAGGIAVLWVLILLSQHGMRMSDAPPTTAAAPAKEWVELEVKAGETGFIYARSVGEDRDYGSGCSKIVAMDNGREYVLYLPSPRAKDNDIPIGDEAIKLTFHTYPDKECVVWRKKR